jgi:hypothetical protein
MEVLRYGGIDGVGDGVEGGQPVRGQRERTYIRTCLCMHIPSSSAQGTPMRMPTVWWAVAVVAGAWRQAIKSEASGRGGGAVRQWRGGGLWRFGLICNAQRIGGAG